LEKLRGCRISPDQENRKENKENLNPESADEKPTRSYGPQTRPLMKNPLAYMGWRPFQAFGLLTKPK